MAKKQRFPSPANPSKAAKAAPGPLPEAVSATKQATVQVEYKKENNHILGIGAHALAKGINTIPVSVWSEAKKHPSIQKLISDGHAVEAKLAAEFEEQPPADNDHIAEGSEKFEETVAKSAE